MMRYLLLFSILINGLWAAADNPDAGTAAMQFLKLGKSARATALGDAYAAMPGDISAMFYNPAGVFNHHKFDVTVTYSRLYTAKGANLLNLAGKVKHTRIGDIGLGATALFFGSETSTLVERGEIIDGGEFSSAGFEVIAHYSRGFVNNNLVVGVNLKSAFEKLGGTGVDSGGFLAKFVADAGMLMSFGIFNPSLGTLNYGISLKQLGVKEKADGEEYPLPLTLKTGFSYLLWINKKNEFLFLTEFEKAVSDDFRIALGTRYRFLGMGSISFGYRIGEGLYGINTGVGFITGGLNIDYSFDFVQFDMMHRIEFSYGVKARKEKTSVDAIYYTGQKYFGNYDYEKAEKYFKRALAIDPNHEKSRERIWEIEEIRQKKKNLEIFEKAMETIE